MGQNNSQYASLPKGIAFRGGLLYLETDKSCYSQDETVKVTANLLLNEDIYNVD